MNTKLIGLCIVTVFAISIILGGVHSAIMVIEATNAPAEPVTGDYVPRLTSTGEDDPALAALRYVCPFH